MRVGMQEDMPAVFEVQGVLGVHFILATEMNMNAR